MSKSGDNTNGDNCNFYGLNSIALSVGNDSLLKISNSKLSATSEGSNGVFSTDSATAYVRDSSITTSAGNSRGLDATYGGTILADTLDISTQGNHSAGVATDRGGGNISLTNSTIKTAGSGSPLLYSTGDIELNNVTGSSSGSGRIQANFFKIHLQYPRFKLNFFRIFTRYGIVDFFVVGIQEPSP